MIRYATISRRYYDSSISRRGWYFYRENTKFIPLQWDETYKNSLIYIIGNIEQYLSNIKSKIETSGYVNIDTNNNLLNYLATWFHKLNLHDPGVPTEIRDQIKQQSTDVIKTILQYMTERQRTNMINSFILKNRSDKQLLVSQLHILSLWNYNFISHDAHTLNFKLKYLKC